MDTGLDFTKKEYDKSESESDDEDETSQPFSKVSDLRSRFLENFENFENKSSTSYSTQSSVVSSRKISKDSKSTVTTIKTQYHVSSRTISSSTNKDQNFNTTYSNKAHHFTQHNVQQPTAVLPVFPRPSPQTSPKPINKGASPDSPKEFKPRKEPPSSNGNSRSEIIAKRKASPKLVRTHDPTSGTLNDWNRKFTQTKAPKALGMFKRLESESAPSPSTAGTLNFPSRNLFSFPNEPSRNSIGSTMSSDRSSMGSIPSELISSPVSQDEYVPRHTSQDEIYEEFPSENVQKEVRVEVKETPKTKVFKIATELLTTEREYVRILELIEKARNNFTINSLQMSFLKS